MCLIYLSAATCVRSYHSAPCLILPRFLTGGWGATERGRAVCRCSLSVSVLAYPVSNAFKSPWCLASGRVSSGEEAASARVSSFWHPLCLKGIVRAQVFCQRLGCDLSSGEAVRRVAGCAFALATEALSDLAVLQFPPSLTAAAVLVAARRAQARPAAEAVGFLIGFRLPGVHGRGRARGGAPRAGAPRS